MQKKNKMTESKQDTVYVVLRVTKAGEPIAFLYGENMPTNYGTVTSYQHVGQHSEASIDYIKEGGYYLIRYEKGVIRAWGAIKAVN